MRQLPVAVIAAAALVGLAGTARAGSITYDLDLISSMTIGPAGTTLGTVTLTQSGSDQVDVAVTLEDGAKFVDTGGHTSFAFNLDLTPTAVTPTGSNAGLFTVLTKPPFPDPSYGKFTDGIECNGCGPGASHANPGPLDFSVTDTSGISLTDFVDNAKGYYFAADVIGPLGGTGAIAADAGSREQGPPPSVPEPASLAVLALGLLGLGAARARRA